MCVPYLHNFHRVCRELEFLISLLFTNLHPRLKTPIDSPVVVLIRPPSCHLEYSACRQITAWTRFQQTKTDTQGATSPIKGSARTTASPHHHYQDCWHDRPLKKNLRRPSSEGGKRLRLAVLLAAGQTLRCGQRASTTFFLCRTDPPQRETGPK